jgi:hypothetical protein
MAALAPAAAREIIPAIPEGRLVDTNTLRQIFDAVKTPRPRHRIGDLAGFEKTNAALMLVLLR